MSLCPVCSSENHSFYIKKHFRSVETVWHKCKDCGSAFILPPPTKQQLEEYYQEYISKESPGYVSHKYRYSGDHVDEVNRMYTLSLQDLGISTKDLLNKRILDFGCANGVFLDYCYLNGCSKDDLFGFDISREYMDQISGKGYNRLKKWPVNYFDFIFLWDVIEHVLDPDEILKPICFYIKNRWGGDNSNTLCRYFV